MSFYGQFTDGVLDGLGRFTLDNGDIYDGQFKGGKFYGLGVYFNNENTNYFLGVFRDNKCTKHLKYGDGFPTNELLQFKQKIHQKNKKYFSRQVNLSSLQIIVDYHN